GLVPGEVALDVADAPVDAILLLQTRLEAQPEHLGMAPELPGVRLLTGELGAVDPRLLASTDADHLTAYRIADGVRLRVLQGRVTEHQIAPRCLAQRTDHDIVQIVESEDPVVARLRQ